MSSLWSRLASAKNRQIVSWLGGGVVAVAIAAWTVITYVWPAGEPAKTLCAQQGVNIAGNVSGSTVSNTVTGSSSTGPCIENKP